MTVAKTSLLLAGAALALAACNKPAPEKAADAGPSAKPATAAASATVMPKRKAGLWEQTMQLAAGDAGGPGMTQTAHLCVDPTSEGDMAAMGVQMSKDMKCSQTRVTRRPDGALEFSSVCPAGESGTITSTGVITGDFNSAYKMEMTSTTTGAANAHMDGEHHMTMSATWQGPCPADMKPGEIRVSGVPGMPGGASFNPAEMARAGRATGAAQVAAMRARAEAMRREAGQ